MREPLFFDDNLLAGTTTSKFFGAPVYPELTGMTIWPELDTIGSREKNPLKLSREEAEELNFEIFPYWIERNILEYARRKYGNPECMKLFERLVYFIAGKAGAISHTVPCYRVGLERGLGSIISEAGAREAAIADAPGSREKREFYSAVRTALQGGYHVCEAFERPGHGTSGSRNRPGSQTEPSGNGGCLRARAG